MTSDAPGPLPGDVPGHVHWARWGDPAEARALPVEARALVDGFLHTTDRPAVQLTDVRLPPPLRAELVDELAALVGPAHVLTDAESRVRHTRGRSTTDLLLIRSGDASEAPDAVVRPGTHEEVQAVLDWCVTRHVALVPRGGGTSVVGGLSARRHGYEGVLSLDLGRLDRVLEVDAESRTAVLEAGLRGPRAEALLAEHGLTLGHHPQSFEYATIGGFAATRSSGQSSAGYGRFDAMVQGLTVATPRGTLELGRSPANAAGPDLRQWVLGSEGAFGVVTSVRLRVRPVPEERAYEAWRFPSYGAGVAAARSLAQRGPLPTVLRLSDEPETALNLATPDAVGAASEGGCLMVVGHEGDSAVVRDRREACAVALRGLGGSGPDPAGGDAWAAGRFRGPYLRDSLLDAGVLVETVETATWWSRLLPTYDAVKRALEQALGADGRPVLVLCHLSHVYETGASLYFTVAAAQDDDPVSQWRSAKSSASEAMVRAGGSITHHHGVGRDHQPWLVDEIGQVGVEMLRGVKDRLDPTGVLNPGVLVP